MVDTLESTIRRAKVWDLYALRKVIVESVRATNVGDYPAEDIEHVIRTYSPLRALLMFAYYEMFVALVGKRVVGTATLDNAAIHAVFVAPDLQNKGIGRRLIRELECRARARGTKSLKIESSITAERFYTKLGFVALGDHYRSRSKVRMIMMQRDLQESA